MRTRTRIHSLTRARTHTHTRERERVACPRTCTHPHTKRRIRRNVLWCQIVASSHIQSKTRPNDDFVWWIQRESVKKWRDTSTQTHDRAFKARGMVKERKRAPDLLLKLCVHRYVCGVFVPVCMCVRHTAASIKRTEKVKTLRMTSFMPDITVVVDWA